jgi:deoxyxylulose-5-phosphate synthase
MNTEMVAYLHKYDHIFTLEENVYDGGFGQRLNFALPDKKVHSFAIRDEFLPTATREELFKLTNLDADSVFGAITEIINHGKTP